MENAFTYRVIRSNRKTASIQITSDGEVLVRCPKFMRENNIEKLLKEKSKWIHAQLCNFQKDASLPPFSDTELKQLAQQAKTEISEHASRLSKQMGLTYGRITIRCQRSRWGSCSSAGNLNFNCLLMLAPPEVREYVIIHELCHRREMNHSPAFWKEVETYQPDYRIHRAWLKEEGIKLIRRLPK